LTRPGEIATKYICGPEDKGMKRSMVKEDWMKNIVIKNTREYVIEKLTISNYQMAEW